MKNSKLRRVLLLLACAVLLVSLSVGATLAYLTSDDQVTNTFTIGNVKITLDEAAVNVSGVRVDKDGKTEADMEDGQTWEAADRVKANTYKLLPGHPYTKDPIIHVDANSEPCFVYVEIKNEISAIEDKDATIAKQMEANGWKLVPGETNIFYQETAFTGGNNVPVFASFKVAGDVKDLTLYKDKTVVVKAYAIQADGFNDALAAWTTAKGELTLLP